ncbi:MAG: OpgC domain-containing protein, partial [Bradyrhizobium sp.]
TAALVYGKMMLERGVIASSLRLIKRGWSIYVAHVFLFVIYLAEIGYLAQKYDNPDLADQFNVHGFLNNPADWLYEGLILRFKPVNMDVLPLYIVLIFTFPAVLWALLRRPHLTMLASLALYVSARHFGWNLSSYPAGEWYFNPFAWQLYFVAGAWCVVGGAVATMPFIRSRALVVLGTAYLMFAFVMTMAGRFPELGQTMPIWLYDAFVPNDKTNLAPYRFVHFIVVAFMVTRFMPLEWRGLKWRVFRPIILCGQHSLAVFCTGVFLSFAAYFVLVEVSGAIWMQVVVSVVGIVLLTLLAWFKSLAKKLDH